VFTGKQVNRCGNSVQQPSHGLIPLVRDTGRTFASVHVGRATAGLIAQIDEQMSVELAPTWAAYLRHKLVSNFSYNYDDADCAASCSASAGERPGTKNTWQPSWFEMVSKPFGMTKPDIMNLSVGDPVLMCRLAPGV
jgi:hypothetical protein